MGKRKRTREATVADETSQDSQLAKRSRQFTEQDKRLVTIYEELASEVSSTRIEAAKALLTDLFEGNEHGADVNVENVIRRLIKGLCSSRKAARLGFFVALTEVLHKSFLGPSSLSPSEPPLSLSTILDLAVKSTEVEGGASGQEKRDHLLGRVAACNAILLSHILEEPTLATEELTRVLDLLSSLAASKSWIREECGNVIYTYVQSLGTAKADSVGELILESLQKNELLKTPEGVAIWVALQLKVKPATLPKHVWTHDDPLHSKNWHAITAILRTGTHDTTEDLQKDANRRKGKGGASQPNPSFAWHAIISAFASANAPMGTQTNETSSKSFENFWKELVDNTLFAQSASQEKKGWGFAVLASSIATLPSWTISSLFSSNLMKSLINQRADVNRYLHSAALIPLNAVKKRVTQEPATATQLLRVLLSIPDVTNFDQATKSKTLEAIVSAPCSAEVLLELATTICSLWKEAVSEFADNNDPRRAKSRSTVLLDLLVLLVRQHSIYLGDDGSLLPWNQYILSELGDAAYIHEVNVLGSAIQVHPDMFGPAGSRLQTCLSIILGVDSTSGGECARFVVNRVHHEAIAPNSSTNKLAMDKTVRKRVQASHEMLHKLEMSDSRLEAIALLHCFTLMEVYGGEPDALAVLDDLEPVYASLSQKGSTNNDHDHSVTVTEILLSCISKPSTLFKKLAERVFTAMTPHLTMDALQVLIEVLGKAESLSGQQELFDKADDVEDVSEEDSDGEGSEDEDSNAEDSDPDDSSLDSDVEVIESDGDIDNISDHVTAAKINGTADREGSGSDSSDDSGSEAQDDADEEELLKLDAVLAQTLSTSNKTGGEDEEDSDADMDDDEMMALEPALTKIFQERRKVETSNKKQERKDAKQTMITFKNRVLDLLQLYVKKEPSNSLAIALILPLLDLIRSTNTRQLGEKAFNVLKTYFDTVKSKPLPQISGPGVDAVLRDIHKAVARKESKMYATACSRSSLFLSKVLIAAHSDYSDTIEDIYSNTMKEHIRQGQTSLIQRSFFLDWTNYAYDLCKQR